MRAAALLMTCALAIPAAGQSDRPFAHPKQGLVDMLMEYMKARYPEHATSGDVLYVSVARQRLFHARGGILLAEYLIATSSNGLGSAQDSYRTPEGLHRVAEKHGAEAPLYGILKDRDFTGQIAGPDVGGADKDWITSRIFWLDGLEPGLNKGAPVDSYERFIYIHGTANERSLGTPSSRGCIRMRNEDVVELFEQVGVGAVVVILDN